MCSVNKDFVIFIGLVLVILLFVMFGMKLVKGGIEIYCEGNLLENVMLEDVIVRMDFF